MTHDTAEVKRHPPASETSETGPAQGYLPHKENYLKRLRRIEGQVRGIARMIDEDKYCIDVLTQISAVNSALRSVALTLLDEHLGHCVSRAVAGGGAEAAAKLDEASAAIARLVRS
jgi:DNA-binding FrmR family transcriptional regulator